MTKQEEIREEVPNFINKHIKRSQDCGRRGISLRGSGLYLDAEPFMEEVLTYLHSQGVVIKVDRKLPATHWENEDMIRGWNIAEKEMLNAGYVAVEPLIEVR